MDDGLKQRIIGALVLLALGVIFIPVVFDKERIEPVDRQTQIPPQPLMEMNEITPPAEAPRPKEPELIEPVQMAFVPDDKKPADSTPIQKPSLSDDGLAQSWIVQVASFTKKERAQALRDELREAGHQAYIRTVSMNNGERTRVYIGPSLDKNALLESKLELEKQYNLQTILLKFK